MATVERHLIKNLGEALKKMLDGQNPALRKAAKEIAVQYQHKKYEQSTAKEVEGPSTSLSTSTANRALLFQEVKSFLDEEYSSRKIAKKLQIGRNTVNKYRYLDYYPAKNLHINQLSSVLPYKEYLAKRWEKEERNKKQLWREISEIGYKGSPGSVYRFFEKLPKDVETIPVPELEIKNWRPSKIKYLLCKKSSDLSKEEKHFLNVLFKHCPEAKQARQMALNFCSIFEKKEAHLLLGWIIAAKNSGIASLRNFAFGLERDYAAVEAAATYHWSSGQVEGQVNRLKMIKRQRYGRAGFDLLRKRVVNHHASG